MWHAPNKHHNKRTNGKSYCKNANEHGHVNLGLVEVLFGLSGILVIIGTILAMSEVHKFKIIAVWVLVGAVIVAVVAIGVRLTHEFSGASKPKERAMVVPIAFSGEPKVNEPFTAYVRYKNTGKVPAKDVRVVFLAYVIKKGEKPDFSLVEKEPAAGGSVSFLVPGQEFTSFHPETTTKPLTVSHIAEIESGDMVIYAFGKIYYRDTPKCSHWTTFCTYYIPKAKRYSNYSEYNETDEVSCPP